MCQACNDLYNVAPNLWNTGITTAVCNNLQNNTGVSTNTSRNNCTDLGLMANCLTDRYIGRLASADPCNWGDYLGSFLKDFKIYENAIICNECGQWANINELWIEINKIWEAITNIATGGIYATMRYGTDFTAEMYNGFGVYDVNDVLRSDQTPIVEYYSIQDYYYLRIRFNATSYKLRNTDLIGNGVTLAHASNPEDVPGSWIYRVTFINSFAFLNTYGTYINTSGSATGIWNINPASARARWQATCNMQRDVPGVGPGLVCVVASYADGYNSQFNVYSPAIDGVATSNLNLINTFVLGV